jgi:tetratricopeptide (TPR) repeat protein
MVRRIATASVLCFLLLSATLVITNVRAAGHFEWPTLPDITASTSSDTDGEKTPVEKKEGKGFMSALSAPFRAIGNLFGGKKNAHLPKRVNDKAVAKFESAPVMRVTNDSSPLPTALPKSDWDPFEAHLSQGRRFLSGGDANSAIGELSLATSINPKSAEAQKLLGLAYENKLLHDRALKAFEAAAKIDGNNADHLNNYGYMLYKTGDYDRATKYLKRAAKIAPNNARVWNNLAQVQCQRGKFEEAYASFVKAVGEFGGHVNVAIQLQRFGFAKDAIKHFESARQIQPTSYLVLTRLVALYDMTGRPGDAESARQSLAGLKTFADAKP